MTTGISSRWKPGHVVRIDTERGTFEEVNPPMLSTSETDVQVAFLPKLRTKPASTQATQTVYSRAWERARAAQGLKARFITSGCVSVISSKPIKWRIDWYCTVALAAMACIGLMLAWRG